MWVQAMGNSRTRLFGPALAALTLTLALLACAAGARATPLAQASRVGSAPSSQQLQLVFPLVADSAGLQRFATAVTTVGSPEYGEYESIAQLSSRFGATPRTRARVVRFLRAQGARGIRVDATGLFVDATLAAGTAERLFGTSLSTFRTARGARFTAPGNSVSLPAGLQGLVTTVVGLNTRRLAPASSFRRGSVAARAAQGSSAGPSGYECGSSTPCQGTLAAPGAAICSGATGSGGFTPYEYRTAYGYTNAPITSSTQGQGERVALIEIDGFNDNDIKAFAKCFGLRIPEITGFDANGNLGRPLAPGGESTLDVEVVDAVAPGLAGIDVYESNSNAAQTLQALTAPLQNSGYKPQVISASLGLCEADTVASVGARGVAAANDALEVAAASGISILAAAGDDGSADCTDQNGAPVGKLAVNYPASSPWVTGVGGTNFQLNAANQITGQIVWNDTDVVPGAAGGGGLSVGSIPSYQRGVVLGTNNRRAVPDVSMLADIAPGYAIYCTAATDCRSSDQPHGGWQTVGGTSAGTPLLAGGFALVDQMLRLDGKQGLGFVNPLLYKIGASATLDNTPAGQVFYDVTQGSNDVGPFVGSIGTSLGCCTAAPGFDEASGWGSVNLAAFATDALTFAPAIVNLSMTVPAGQRPVHARHIIVKLSCTGSCDVGAYATLRVHGKNLFTAVSNPYALGRAGTQSVAIPFSSSQLRTLRTALAHHDAIVASIRGAIIDPAGNIEKLAHLQTLTIRS